MLCHFSQGFIVVAACVMTFEQRDNAAKTTPNRLHLNSMHGHSINRHSKSSPSSRQPLREGSGRRHTPVASYLIEPVEDFARRDLTADFIQFSRNLQQANIEKSLVQQAMGRSPSAPNLAASLDLLATRKGGSLRHMKISRNSLHPLIGQSYLSPHVLHRQALSVDNSEYKPSSISLPRSKRISCQGSSSTGKGSAESLEAELSRRSHSSQTSMMLDLHMPNDCPISMRIRDRNRRSDTARRHMFVRQAQIECEEDSIDRDSTCSSPQFSSIRGVGKEDIYQSFSMPHSRRESYSPRIPSVDDPIYQHRYRINEVVLRGSSPSLQYKRGSYLRSNTVCNEMSIRRGSSTSEASYCKGSADYNYRNRRKSSNTSDSSRYCSRTNVDDTTKPRRSPTSSLKSFKELRDISQKLTEQEMAAEHLRQANHRKCKRNKPIGGQLFPKKNDSNWTTKRSLSPDSISVSSGTTDGHTKSDFTTIDVELTEDEII